MNNDKQKTILEAAQFFGDIARKMVANDGRLQAESLIISVARMSGSMMFRSFNFKQPLTPGGSVFSDEANIHGPKLMNMMLVTVNSLGHTLTEQNLDRDYCSAQKAEASFKFSHDRLAPFFLQYQIAAKLTLQEAAIAAAVAAGIQVHDCRELLAVEKGAALAAYGFVEGTKTAPYPVTHGAAASKTTGVKDTENKGRTWP